MVKAALKELGLISTTHMRAPQAAPNEAETAVVRSALAAHGLV
jgi:dihydrodipicolinate synthase/N-acetylneuraminate lyase